MTLVPLEAGVEMECTLDPAWLIRCAHPHVKAEAIDLINVRCLGVQIWMENNVWRGQLPGVRLHRPQRIMIGGIIVTIVMAGEWKF